MSVGEVDDGGRPTFRAGLDEEPALRLEVLVHRPVKVEVILGQVREDERGEPNPDETLERRRVRRSLHRAASVAGVEHLAERVLEVDRLRGGSRHGPSLAADPALDGPEEAGPAARRGEDGVAGMPSSSSHSCRSRPPPRARAWARRRTRRRPGPSPRGRWRRRAAARERRADAPRRVRRRRGVPRRGRRCGRPRVKPGTQKKSAPGPTRRVS